MSEHQITFRPLDSFTPPTPWHCEQVLLDGKPIGNLLYRYVPALPGRLSAGGWTQYLISGRDHRPLLEPRCSFLYRQPAVDALVAHATAGMQAA